MVALAYDEIAKKVAELDRSLSHLEPSEIDRLICKELELTRSDLREFRGLKDILDFGNEEHG